MGKAQLEELEKHGMYLSVPHGVSMWPMIRDRKDIIEIVKLKEAPKRYDLVMYTLPNLQGVIHRVLYKKGDVYVICGDNCFKKEYVSPENIHGIATRFYRNGKWYDVNNKWYLFYVHIWCDFCFLRRFILYCRYILKRIIRKLK